MPSKREMVDETTHEGLTTLQEHTMHNTDHLSARLARAATRLHAGELPDSLTVDLMLEAAEALKPTRTLVHDVEELDELVLSKNRPVDHITLRDRFGESCRAVPNRTAATVTIVRELSLREAEALEVGETSNDWPRPITFTSDSLEHVRFPMTVTATQPAWLPLDEDVDYRYAHPLTTA